MQGPLNLMLLLLFSHSVVSDSLQPHGLEPARLLCPWDFPGKNPGVGCHFLFQGIFRPRDGICISCIDRQVLYHWATGVAPLVWWGLGLSDQKLREFQGDSLPACFSPISLYPKALILKMKWVGFREPWILFWTSGVRVCVLTLISSGTLTLVFRKVLLILWQL